MPDSVLIGVVVVVTMSTLYLAYRSWVFSVFLAGAFLVSSGIQFYLAWTNVSVPIVGTTYVQTPGLSKFRATIHLLLFLVASYSGFGRSHKNIGNRGSA